ncbi:AraC family transcriptional regulator [Nitrospira moscoviensis]|uniref:Transcriptional regulator, AraC family n=1 Tax=Nitrospira moscoviensis TaxID=42253 RepID=A0A0K2GB84_NITMO|nr:AraC family transcriptional regulator [Nitrospira moscoviensis]ALA58134.1 Transcriptional regulator, AraC family [Nitrospira moscoviensis]
MDVLSEVLKAVKLDGAIFFNGEFSAPWCAVEPDSCTMASYLSVQSKHVVIFHLVTEGHGYVRVEHDGTPLPLAAGDIVILPHGHAHRMGNGPAVAPMNSAQTLSRVLSEGLKLSRFGGGGELTKLICGYMTCDPQLSRMLLAGLPSIVKINIRDDAAGRWLEDTLRYSVDHAEASGPGGAAVVAKLSEALFVETLRRYIAELPPAQTGWLAGVRDPGVGKALALLHQEPARPWTIATLAGEVGVSRSVLAERFRHYLSDTPIGYLTRWRMHLAAQLLRSTSKSVAEVAGDVGYESEASFNRAFKREFHLPPARFRANSRSGRAGAAVQRAVDSAASKLR